VIVTGETARAVPWTSEVIPLGRGRRQVRPWPGDPRRRALLEER
jgi:hypothetical protein